MATLNERKEINLSINDYDPILFSNEINKRIKTKPMYFELKFSSIKEIYGRTIVLRLLEQALEYVPNNYGFLIWDVYRSRAVQARLFDWMSNEIKQKNPDLTDSENYNETCKYMSPPSKIGDFYCPPHLSGGAIDLTLFEINRDAELDMGTVFDDCTEKAGRDYFNLKQNLSCEEIAIKDRRNILRNAMEKVGFTSYEFEWWHFDIGDVFWSRVHGCSPLFGPLFGDLEWPEK